LHDPELRVERGSRAEGMSARRRDAARPHQLARFTLNAGKVENAPEASRSAFAGIRH
jgi:hypothetical protein